MRSNRLLLERAVGMAAASAGMDLLSEILPSAKRPRRVAVQHHSNDARADDIKAWNDEIDRRKSERKARRPRLPPQEQPMATDPIGDFFCKGAIALGSGCMRCGRCAVQLAEKVRALEAALAAPPVEQQAAPAPAAAPVSALTYSSTQATECAGCGVRKHTPLRIDAMGGYVCLTCIDNKLGSMLGEFGHPEPAQPAPSQPARAVMQQALDALNDLMAVSTQLDAAIAEETAHTAIASLRAALSATQEKPHD